MTPQYPSEGDPQTRPNLRLAAEPVPVIATPGQLCEALGIGFSDEQMAAITAPLEPGVIIAGAGSGKTTVMAARVVWLVGSGRLRPEQVLGLTFTRKAAAELSARVRDALQRSGAVNISGIDEAGEQVIMTYDAFAARLLAEHGLRIGVDSGLKMITGATRFRLATRVVRAAAGPFEHLSRILPVTVADRVLRLDGEIKSHLITAAELDLHAREYRVALGSAPTARGGKPYAGVVLAADKLQERLELARLVGDYQRLKADLGVVEFADQMALAAHLVERAPEVAKAQREMFSVVLLDEYQDTSAAQAKLLQGLFTGPDTATGRGHPVTAVGDPYQAIYGWRGAAASNIVGFATDFPRSSGEPAHGFNLRVNRRSGQAILDVANQIATSLTSSGGGGHAEGLIAPPQAGQGQVRAATFETWGEELSWIGDEIVAAREQEEVTKFSDIAVLARRNEDLGAMFGELVAREIPAEIVGLGGLLSLPEVADVVATLRLLDDVSANPDLIRLLSGARWRIGPDDLALLGRRARELARTDEEAALDPVLRPDPDAAGPDWRVQLAESLDQAVAQVDRSEVICLLDALGDPGNLGYSVEAKQRFALLAAELATLRRHTGEPVLDLTRRVVETMGLGVELVATAEYVKTSRRDQLAAFIDAVAGYVDVDGDGSLAGLLGYLQAEAETGNGLDQAVPSADDSVKLLTVHKAKGLEWELVFLPALMQGIFPSERVTNNWVTTAEVVPNELRGDAGSIAQLGDATRDAMEEFKAALKAEHRLSEDRLAYVAVTRAKRTLVGTGHYWRPTGVEPRTPSRYLQAILDAARPHGRVLCEATPPAKGAKNPLTVGAAPTDWPAVLDPAALERRRLAAAAVGIARRRFAETGEYEADESPLPLDEESVVAQWDGDVASLLAEAKRLRSGVEAVELPASLTASQLIHLTSDPQAFAAELLRPMPRRPMGAARLGTLFHSWVERFFGQGTLFDPEERQPDVLQVDHPADPDGANKPEESAGELQLAALTEAFGAGQFAERNPMALESSFSLLLGDSVIRGRIDAVFRDLDPETGFDYQVIDWKTGRGEAVDDLQLAIYRLAWAQRMGVELSRVDACFYFVASDRLVRPPELADEQGLADLLAVVQN